MKKKLIYALGVLMTAGFVSCDLTEVPTSSYEMDSYFQTEAKAQMAVVGIYDVMQGEKFYGQWIMPFFYADDLSMVRGTGSDGTRRDLSHYMFTPSNTWIASIWTLAYQGLDRANLAIANIEKMAGFEENANLKAIAAEARFLRAYLAFDLVRFFGDVPFTTQYTSGYDQVNKPRTDRELIYDQMIEDLNFAKENLKKGSEVRAEVPCRGAARAMLMRVYLQRAGYSLKMDGQLTRPDDATRKTYFNAVIDEWTALQAEGYHGFYTGGYEQLFKNYSQLVVNNQESMWEIAFEPNQGEPDNAGMWATWNGPLVAAPGDYPGTSNYMGRANAFILGVPWFRALFEVNADGSQKDIRRDVSVVDYQYRWNADTESHNKNTKHNDIVKNAYRYPGKWRREWMALGFVNPNNTGVNYCPIRYADAVLMAAEAYNETGNSGMAWDLLNSVRSRAGATEVDSWAEYQAAHPKLYDISFISDDFQKALFWERAFELSFEGQRKYDLTRWGVLGEALVAASNFGRNGWVPTEADNVAKWEGGEAWVKANYLPGINFVKGKHELYPLPLAEIQSNPALGGKNNPGFE